MASEEGGVVEQFCSMTGVDVEQAQQFLEMGGYDLELAMQLFFGGLDGEGTGGGGGGGRTRDPSEWWSIVFEGDGSVPDSWAVQGLGFDYTAAADEAATTCSVGSDWQGLGIVQPKNGPCGVLAAFQGTVVANLMDEGRLQADVRPGEADVARGVATILTRIAQRTSPPSPVRLCTSVATRHYDELPGDADEAAVAAHLLERGGAARFAAAGGAVLLVYSAVLTRTAAQVTADMAASGAEPTLVVGPFHTCTSGLLSLLLVGWAEDNVSAYQHSGAKNDWGVTSRVGLLSGMESELRILINDALKFPTRPIFVTHGRDHFTLLFQPDSNNNNNNNNDDDEQLMRLIHWNGLPPGGPRFSRLTVRTPHGSVARAAATAEQGIGVEYKPTVNSIDSLIQAHGGDRSERPKHWRTWRYEVALVVDDPSNVSPELPADRPRPPTFQLPDEVQPAAVRADSVTWRCRACYETRFRTMCFGNNDVPLGTPVDQWICRHCDKPRSQVGDTLWLHYDQLPSGWQAHADKEFGPKIAQLLRSKWPGAVILEQPDHLPSI